LRLRPSREEQTEDRDEEQDGGHGSRIGLGKAALHPWSAGSTSSPRWVRSALAR
jgi:hypothetical protein